MLDFPAEYCTALLTVARGTVAGFEEAETAVLVRWKDAAEAAFKKWTIPEAEIPSVFKKIIFCWRLYLRVKGRCWMRWMVPTRKTRSGDVHGMKLGLEVRLDVLDCPQFDLRNNG